MTSTITHDVHRRYGTLCPNLPESITTPHAQQDALVVRLRDALAVVNDLADERHDDAARAADAQLAAAAVRADKLASTVGTPNADTLATDRKAATGEVDALVAAIGQLDAEIGTEFGILVNNPKTSGITETSRLMAKYVKSVETMLADRATAFASVNRTAYLHLAAPSETWPETAAGDRIAFPAWLTEAMRRLHSPRELTWTPHPPLVPVNRISTRGELDCNISPVAAEYLVAQTFGTETLTTKEN